MCGSVEGISSQGILHFIANEACHAMNGKRLRPNGAGAARHETYEIMKQRRAFRRSPRRRSAAPAEPALGLARCGARRAASAAARRGRAGPPRRLGGGWKLPCDERSERTRGGAWRRDARHETIANAARRERRCEEGRSRARAGGIIYWRGSAARIPLEVAAWRR